jgi:hypothetical protein
VGSRQRKGPTDKNRLEISVYLVDNLHVVIAGFFVFPFSHLYQDVFLLGRIKRLE